MNQKGVGSGEWGVGAGCAFPSHSPLPTPFSASARIRRQVSNRNMKKLISSFAIMAVACAFARAGYLGSSLTRAARAQDDAGLKREQLYRLNNIGVAFMEQFKHEDAM